MQRAKVIGTAVTATLSVFVLIFMPINEFPRWMWGVAFAGIVGDVVTTSLFPRFDLEEQTGIVRRICGPQPSLKCMTATRIPVLVPAAALYFTWRNSGITVRSGVYTIPPEGIPLILGIMGVFATFWNISGYRK
jgi:hypothetical protein